MKVENNFATREVIPAILRNARDLRHPLTEAEKLVWAKVRNRGLGFKIRRQHPIWRFVADFYCAEAKLVIEIDGDSHSEADQADYDLARTKWLEEDGYSVIRFTNEEAHTRLFEILDKIVVACKSRTEPS